ncbi:DUF1840 domain-containing protein [Ideonella paludis]|uniref:DUF1840 domain-containing protein n=1 Tax=Ideonella paludis TaxID=1233411 RepID=A0ABS5DZN7_9BURK|nr:DUF1840 domain-containing protein [Ideonella paludis]MBQ0936630.1 DUF1840 domain-containing protein [Ideonella paludis]
MIYKFKSKASGDVIMLGALGDRLLTLMGKEPATKGIIEPTAFSAAIAALQAAIADEERAQAQAQDDDEAAAPSISLRQRAWPLIDMMQRCQAADEPIVWGV